MMPRNGMYSPNGTSWRLTYIVVGPRPGTQSWPALRSGSCRTSPTRTGRPTAATVAASSLKMSGFWRGSWSVEFSGQITRAGAGSRPALTCAASFSVAATWFCVTSLSFNCCGRFLARGTLPWIAATGTVGAPAVGSTGSRPPARTRPAVTTAASAAPQEGGGGGGGGPAGGGGGGLAPPGGGGGGGGIAPPQGGSGGMGPPRSR